MARTDCYWELMSVYVNETTTHGVRKVCRSGHPGRRLFWTFVFLISLGGCCYHCSYLITNYASGPKVTITEEKDAEAVEFPSITLCNLNVIKKGFADDYFEMASKQKNVPKRNATRKICFRSEEELAARSAIDLSDTFVNLGVTKDNLSQYGHRESDLIIQCTYNSIDCRNGSHRFITDIKNRTSPTFGVCHTISMLNVTGLPLLVKQGGTETGLRLTLNIEREQYWDLVSSEYGVRILVHPQGTYPTLQRGGIIVSPGRSAHIGIRRRVSSRLPGTERSCTESFEDSEVMHKLAELHLDFDVSNVKYTYEYCNILCQNAILYTNCNCFDEPPRSTVKGKFCNPCNIKQSTCRSEALRNFSEAGNLCDDVCKPACNSIRYDISLSKASWPNINHQQFVMNRSRKEWLSLPQALGLLELPFDDFDDANVTDFVNDTFFSENLLRAHLFIEEMIYMSIQERFSYTLPKLLADLGGCLGLYLGVSVISIIELVELFGNASMICLCGTRNHSKVHSSSFARHMPESRRRRKHRTGVNTVGSYASNFRPPLISSRNKHHQRNKSDVWRPLSPVFDPSNDNRSISRRNDSFRRY